MKLTRLSLVARNGIERLRAQGIDPDLDDIACLHDLGRRLERPEGSPALSVLGNPVKAGNVILWPWSIGSERWYNQRAAPWFQAVPDLEFYALVYSHAMARRPDVLVSLVDRKDAAAAIVAWVNICTATRKELTDALDKLLPEEQASARKRYCPECGQRWHDQEDREREEAVLPAPLDDSAFFDIIAVLMKTFPGTSLEYWTWTTPQALTFRILDRHINQGKAQGDLDPRSPAMQATHAFEMAIRAIRDKHLARQKRQEAAQAVPGVEDTAQGGNGPGPAPDQEGKG